jgi:multiple antibiotic resistance protein
MRRACDVCATRRHQTCFEVGTLVQDHLQSIVTMLALINPVMCGAIFTQLEGARPRHVLLGDATMAALVVLIILVLAALCGTRILDLFGVSLDAFSVAGGGVLSWIGFSMLSGSANAATSAPHEDSGKKVSLAPLILFAASPGTITGVITLAAAHTRLLFPVTALVAVVVATTIMWLAIVLTIVLMRNRDSGGLAHDMVTRFMGLIVIAMGVQFALTGARAFFQATKI